MNHELLSALEPIAERLQQLADRNPEVASWVRDICRLVLALTEAPLAVPPPSPIPPPPTVLPEVPPPVIASPTTLAIAAPPVRPAPVIPSLSVEIHEPAPEPAVEPTRPAGWYRSVYDEELPLIEQRCRLKAEGARWAAKRRRLLKEGANYETEIEPNDQQVIARAKELPDCFLWMCHRDGPSPEDLALFEDLAGCFDVMAGTVNLLQTLIKNPEDAEAFEQTLDLAAEAQSCVRLAILAMNGPTDGDQQKVFSWLRSAAAERGILIRRYMRRDDPAQPAAWPELQERIQQLEERLQRYKNRDRRHKTLFNKIRYHIKRIIDEPGDDKTHDWSKVIESVDQLVIDGLPPSNVELRDLLLPVLDDFPDNLELTKNASLVLRELDRFLSSRPTKPDPATTITASQEVRRVRDLLKGRCVIMIGGDRRPFSADALVDAFNLKELIWIETREHQTHTIFEPHVARPDVALVLLAIRWSSHSFGEVKEYCDKYGKPLVHLPAGYNPNQVAFHIDHQVGERLRQTG